MQNFEALFLPHPDAAERFGAFAPITIPRLAPAAHLADMPDELLRHVYARTRVAEPTRFLHVTMPRFNKVEALRLTTTTTTNDAPIVVISTNLDYEGRHPASRLKLRVWLGQEIICCLHVPRNDNEKPGFVCLTGPSSAHDARHLFVCCTISGPGERVNLWAAQVTVGGPPTPSFIHGSGRSGSGEDAMLATAQDLEGTSLRVTCSP